MHDRGKARGFQSVSRFTGFTVGSALVVATALPGLAAAGGQGGYVFRQDSLPALQGAQSTVIEGRRVAGGCEWPAQDEAVKLSIGEAWEVRDIAIDAANCLKIQESGRPTIIRSPGPLQGSHQEILAQDPLFADDSTTTPGGVSPATTGFRYVVHRVWWNDLPGFTVNYDETRSSWVWNVGGCVLDGNSSGDWGWLTGTGWRLVSNSGSANLNCSRYYATTESHFANTTFCEGVSVDAYYYYVRNYGYNTGAFIGSRSSDVYRECLPLYFNYQVVG